MIRKKCTAKDLQEYLSNILHLDVKLSSNDREVSAEEFIGSFGMKKEEVDPEISDETKLSSVVRKIKKLFGLDVKLFDFYGDEVDYSLDGKRYVDLIELVKKSCVMTNSPDEDEVKKYKNNRRVMKMLVASNGDWMKFLGEELALDRDYVFDLIRENFSAFKRIQKLSERIPKAVLYLKDEEILRWSIPYYPNLLGEDQTPQSLKDEYLSSKEKIINILKGDKVQEVGMMVYLFLSPSLQNDEEIISLVLQKRPSILGALPVDQRSNPNWVNLAFESIEARCAKNPQWSGVPYIDEVVQTVERFENKAFFFDDKEWVMRYIKLAPYWIGRNLSVEMKQDTEVAQYLSK